MLYWRRRVIRKTCEEGNPYRCSQRKSRDLPGSDSHCDKLNPVGRIEWISSSIENCLKSRDFWLQGQQTVESPVQSRVWWWSLLMMVLVSVKYGWLVFFLHCSESDQRVMSACNLRWIMCDWLDAWSPDAASACRQIKAIWRPCLVILFFYGSLQTQLRNEKAIIARFTKWPGDLSPDTDLHYLPNLFFFHVITGQLTNWTEIRLIWQYHAIKSGTSDPGPLFDRPEGILAWCLPIRCAPTFSRSARMPHITEIDSHDFTV